ncbi:MAG TPA: DUF4403 family protein [Burkholderiales bacterium]|nr:DUF4403 family protein [Burkholderiales bacterium]
MLLPSAGALALVAIAACQTPVPPMPVAAPPALKPSHMDIAISMPLASLAAALDGHVPSKHAVEPYEFPVNGGAAPPACGIDGGFSLARGPFDATGAGNVITTTVQLGYRLQGRKRIPCEGEFVAASCGVDPESPRYAELSVDTAISILPDFSAGFRSSLNSVTPQNRCLLNPFGVDVTDALVAGLRDRVPPVLAKLDERLAAELDLRTRMELAWSRMGEPREVRPGIWLMLNPSGVDLAPVTITNDELHSGVRLHVQPVITAGTKPESAASPLPQAGSSAESDRFELHVPVQVEESFVQERLDKALEQQSGGVAVGNYKVRVKDATIDGQGTQVIVKLKFEGDVNGTAFLRGTPHYDRATRTLSFPDLDYTLDTDRMLLDSASKVMQGQIRERLRARLTFELAKPIENMRQSLERGLNQTRGHLRLEGHVDELRPIGVYRLRDSDVFTAYLTVKGSLRAFVEPGDAPAK